MNWRPTAALRGWLVAISVGIVGALASGRPEPVVLVAPLAAVVVAALAATPRPELRVSCACAAERALEGDTVVVQVEAVAATALSSVELALALPRGLTAPVADRSVATALGPGESHVLEVPVACERWGRYRVGEVAVRVRGPLGFLVAEGKLEPASTLAVHPSSHVLRGLVRAQVPRAVAGNQRTTALGPGLEFADLRPYVRGDVARDVNWRATARRGSLWVNQWHPERSTDVVLLIDAFSEGELSSAVSAAATLTQVYLRNRDRVGLVSFGGFLRWLSPGSGVRQEIRVAEVLLETAAFSSEADKSIDQIPPQMLPRNALVLALTPLHDERIVRALVDLRSRGVDVVGIELSPLADVRPLPGPARDAAYRLWKLQRSVTRDRLRELGIPIVVWERDGPLAAVVEEVAAWPRASRSAG